MDRAAAQQKITQDFPIQGQIKKDKRTTQESKTQAPPPNGSGACFLFFTGSFPSRPAPGCRRKFQAIPQNFLVTPDEINWTFSELTLKRAEQSGASDPRPFLIFSLPFWKISSALGYSIIWRFGENKKTALPHSTVFCVASLCYWGKAVFLFCQKAHLFSIFCEESAFPFDFSGNRKLVMPLEAKLIFLLSIQF